MKSLFPDICSDALAESKGFYVSLFGFVPVFEIDWYIQLRSPNDENVQIAFVARNHASVPQAFQCSPQGVVVTIEATDAAALFDVEFFHQLARPNFANSRQRFQHAHHFELREHLTRLVATVTRFIQLREVHRTDLELLFSFGPHAPRHGSFR